MVVNRFDTEQTRQLLSYVDIAKEIEAVLVMCRAGQAFAPDRLVMSWSPDESLLVMPAYDLDFVINKMVTVYRRNTAFQLPVVQGSVLVFRKCDGSLLLELDGPTVTSFRTAALSLVAMKRLGFTDISSATVIGTGVQARAHIEAIHAQYPMCHFALKGRDAARASRLAGELRNRGIVIYSVSSFEDIGFDSEVIVTATSSTTQVLDVADLQHTTSGARLVVAVGAYRSDMAEVSHTLVERVNRPVIVDTLAGAIHEAGDLIQAGVPTSDLIELAKVDQRAERAPGISMFKSVGNALWDLAACRSVLRKI